MRFESGALVEDGVVVGERFGEAREARGGDLLERRLVRLVPDAAHIQDHAVLQVRHLDPTPTPTEARAVRAGGFECGFEVSRSLR